MVRGLEPWTVSPSQERIEHDLGRGILLDERSHLLQLNAEVFRRPPDGLIEERCRNPDEQCCGDFHPDEDYSHRQQSNDSRSPWLSHGVCRALTGCRIVARRARNAVKTIVMPVSAESMPRIERPGGDQVSTSWMSRILSPASQRLGGVSSLMEVVSVCGNGVR